MLHITLYRLHFIGCSLQAIGYTWEATLYRLNVMGGGGDCVDQLSTPHSCDFFSILTKTSYNLLNPLLKFFSIPASKHFTNHTLTTPVIFSIPT
jgi:hypothetical protein